MTISRSRALRAPALALALAALVAASALPSRAEARFAAGWTHIVRTDVWHGSHALFYNAASGLAAVGDLYPASLRHGSAAAAHQCVGNGMDAHHRSREPARRNG